MPVEYYFPRFQIFATPGTFSFTVPEGVSSITVECIGEGGWGGSVKGIGFANYQSFGGGGAGGSYARKTLSVIPGTTYTVRVGGGDANADATPFTRSLTGRPSYFALGGTNLVYAQGGQGGENMESSNDCRQYGLFGTGSTDQCIGDVVYRGGNGGGFIYDSSLPTNRCGGTISTTTYIGYGSIASKSYTSTRTNCDPEYSGPGGGGAGETGPGGDVNNFCSSSAGGLGNTPGGNGADGKSPRNNGGVGSAYGGGGSGAAITKTSFQTRPGGRGGQGYVKISWDFEDLSCRSLYTSLACCPIAVGCSVYSNPQLTVTASDGYYYDGTQCWIVLNGVVNSTGSCGTTTTTTTTTAAPTVYFYTTSQFSCPDCSSTGEVFVRSSTPLNIGTYYSIADGFTYRIDSATFGPSYDIDLDGAISGASCFSLCIT